MFGPLPEGLENPILEKMLQTAPCPEPLKEDTREGNTGGRGPPTLPILTEGGSVSMKEDDRRRKRTALGDSEAEASKREKKSPIEGPTLGGAIAAQSPRGGSILQRVISDPKYFNSTGMPSFSSEKITTAYIFAVRALAPLK